MINVLVFASCYIGGSVLAFVSNPVYAFMVYQLIYFMNPMNRWWGTQIPALGYSFFTVVIMGVVFIKNFNEHNKNSLFAAPQFKWIFLIAIAYLCTLGYAVNPELNKEATTNFVKLVIIMCLAYKIVDSDQRFDYVLWAYMAGAAYIGYLAFQVGRDSTGRVESVGTVDAPDSNGIAAAIAPSVVICLYYFWVSTNNKARLFIVIAGAFIVNGVVLINSRGAFLATMVGVGYFVFYLLFSKYQRKHQRASAIGLILLGLIALSQVVDRTAIERFLSISEEQATTEQETGKTRLFFWEAAWEMAKDHPFGAGARGFEYYAPEYLPDYVATGNSRNRSVHSTWFESLTDTGYFGLFCLIMMIMSSFKATRRCKKTLDKTIDVNIYFKIIAVEAALITFLVAMSFLNRFRSEILYWCVLFTACAYNIYVLKVDKKAPGQMSPEPNQLTAV